VRDLVVDSLKIMKEEEIDEQIVSKPELQNKEKPRKRT
jgi:hypothetical protein